jgi:hypothetical protein
MTATTLYFRKSCKVSQLAVPRKRTLAMEGTPPGFVLDTSRVRSSYGDCRNKLCREPTRQRRMTSTTIPSSEAPLNFNEPRDQPSFESPILTDTTTSNNSSCHMEPLPNKPASQQVPDILQNVRIGQITYVHIKLILAEAFERCRITNKHATTNKNNIAFAERLVLRLIQEVNYWHIENVELQQQKQQPNSSNKQQTSHLIRSLGAIWHYIILGSSHLPPVSLSIKTREQPRSDLRNVVTPAENFTEQPYFSTGRLLMQMLQQHYQHPSVYPPPTTTLYNAWLYSCYICSSFSDDAVYTAEAILRNLEGPAQLDDTTNKANIKQSSIQMLPPPLNISKPTRGMYNHVILIHANRAGNVYGAAVHAEDWLMRMSKAGVIPTTDTFNRVLKAWSESPEKEGGNRAADVLHLMIKLSDDASNVEHGNEIEPNEISFGTVISAFMKRQQPEACQFILEEALSYYSTHKQRRSQMVDLNECWNIALFSWSKSGRSDAPDRVEQLLNNGIWIQNQQYKVIPTKQTFVACIEVHLKSSRPDRIDQAERYIQIMVESMRRYKGQTSTANVEPTYKEFESVINAWFRSLQEFENIGIGPNIGKYPIGYTATNASNLLYLMIALQEEGHTSCTPSSGSFHMCIESWTKTAGACLTAEQRVRKAIPKSTNAAVNDESVEVAKKYRESMKKHAMNAADKAIEILNIAEDRRLSTDSSYAALIHILCRIADPHYTYQAAEILERYERRTDEWNLTWQKEKVWMYNMVTASLSAIGTLKAAEVALQTLRRIPTSGKRAINKNKMWIYTGVLMAFAKHPGSRAGAVATELFVDLISTPNHNPELNNSIDVDFCERVLWILAEANNKQSAVDACDVLNAIFDLYFSKKLNVEPSGRCFNACLHALTQCRDEMNTKFAIQLLKLIIGKYEEKLLSQLPSKSAIEQVIDNCNNIGSEEMIQNSKEIAMLAAKYITS